MTVEATNDVSIQIEDAREISAEEAGSILTQETPDPDRLWDLYQTSRFTPKIRRFIEDVVENASKSRSKDLDRLVRQGAALWMLGRAKEALDILQECRANIAGAFFLGKTLVHLGHDEEGIDVLEKTANRKPQSPALRYGAVEGFLDTGNPGKALKALKALEKDLGGSARSRVLKGWALDHQGKHEEARDVYNEALDLSDHCEEALFRLAYSMDLYGDDEEAIRLYERIASLSRPSINALVNLGVLYEDRNEFEKAIDIYRRILKAYPNHPRARAFLKDALSSLDEEVDEEREKLEDRRYQTLQIPISDFELSVRSRNCLSKMNIRTLGDLVQKTEAELLSYKNFGETSLGEIKVILESKNLRLGINLDEMKRRERKKRLESLIQKDGDESLRQKPIQELGLSIRSRKCMDSLDIETIGDLMACTEKQLLSTKNFGQTSLLEVKRKLAEQGVSLTEDLEADVDEEEAD